MQAGRATERGREVKGLGGKHRCRGGEREKEAGEGREASLIFGHPKGPSH